MSVIKFTANKHKQKSIWALLKIMFDRLRFYSAYFQLFITWLIGNKLDAIDWKVAAVLLLLPIIGILDIVYLYPREQATAYDYSPISDEISAIQKDLNDIKNLLKEFKKEPEQWKEFAAKNATNSVNSLQSSRESVIRQPERNSSF